MGPRDVRRELLLRIRRSRDQYRARLHDCLAHALQKSCIHRRVTTAARVGLVVNVLMRITAVHRCRIYVRRIEVKDLRLVMVDPDQGMIVLAHKPLPLIVSVQAPDATCAISVLPSGAIASLLWHSSRDLASEA